MTIDTVASLNVGDGTWRPTALALYSSLPYLALPEFAVWVVVVKVVKNTSQDTLGYTSMSTYLQSVSARPTIG